MEIIVSIKFGRLLMKKYINLKNISIVSILSIFLSMSVSCFGMKAYTFAGYNNKTNKVSLYNVKTDGGTGELENNITVTCLDDIKVSRFFSVFADGKEMLYFDMDGGINIYNLQDKTITPTEFSFSEMMMRCRMYNKFLLLADSKQYVDAFSTLKFYTLAGPERKEHCCSVSKIACGSDGNYIVSMSNSFPTICLSNSEEKFDKNVKIWNVYTQEYIKSIHQEDTMYSASLSDDAKYIAIASKNETDYKCVVKILETGSEKLVQEIKPDCYSCRISLSSDGKCVAVYGSDGVLSMFNVETGEKIGCKEGDIIDELMCVPNRQEAKDVDLKNRIKYIMDEESDVGINLFPVKLDGVMLLAPKFLF